MSVYYKSAWRKIVKQIDGGVVVKGNPNNYFIAWASLDGQEMRSE